MKKILFIFSMVFFFFTQCSKDENMPIEVMNPPCDSCAQGGLKSGNYGLYGEVLWPVSGTPYNAVELPTVLIYKWVNGSWSYLGSTGASACGYYTYAVSETGTYRALIQGYYYLRTYPGCATRVEYGWHAGSGDGVIYIWNSWIVVNVRCS
jgi:hypothetical protein